MKLRNRTESICSFTVLIANCLLLSGITNSEHVRHNEELLGPLPSLDVPNDEFGRAARRGKVDVLGLVLKKRIAQLRHVGQTELVFLVDSSASVGSDNFYNEIKFIRKVRHLHTVTDIEDGTLTK